jgi:hypothetical protein
MRVADVGANRSVWLPADGGRVHLRPNCGTGRDMAKTKARLVNPEARICKNCGPEDSMRDLLSEAAPGDLGLGGDREGFTW